MTPDFPTAPPAYGLEGPSAGRTVEKSQPASHTEFLTLPASKMPSSMDGEFRKLALEHLLHKVYGTLKNSPRPEAP